MIDAYGDTPWSPSCSAFRQYVADLVAAAEAPSWLADHLVLLAEGAMTTAAIFDSPEPARQAKDTARILLRTARTELGAPA
ncbi:TetR family transcriptional regulator [Streptomyces hygroscopicus]|nr:TetR family transcriptional regulator [Streptomyces hygroscopicus]